jgi:hypothetical protein
MAHLHFLISAGEVSDSAAILASAICWSPKNKIKSYPTKTAQHTLSFVANNIFKGRNSKFFCTKKPMKLVWMSEISSLGRTFSSKAVEQRGDIKLRMKGLC